MCDDYDDAIERAAKDLAKRIDKDILNKLKKDMKV
jgi:hypothetical protein